MRWMMKVFFILIWSSLASCVQADDALPKGYIKSEKYYDEDSFQDYTDYCKYYYSDEDEEKFAANELYSAVDAQEIEMLIGYFDDFEEWMEIENRSSEYDFDKDCISVGDYFYIKTKEGDPIGWSSTYEKYDNYTVYFYDTQSHTLYYIHNNI